MADVPRCCGVQGVECWPALFFPKRYLVPGTALLPEWKKILSFVEHSRNACSRVVPQADVLHRRGSHCQSPFCEN